jgi:LAO/AO transport system kinase
MNRTLRSSLPLPQVIKRGVTELADVVVVNKADGAGAAAAARAAAAFRGALQLHRRRHAAWSPAALACSAHTGHNIDKLQQELAHFQSALQRSGELAQLRRAQRARVAWAAAEEAVVESLRQDEAARWLAARLLPAVEEGRLAPRAAAEALASWHAMYD